MSHPSTTTLVIAAVGLGGLDHPARAQHAGLAAVGVHCCSRPLPGIAVSGWNGVQIAEVARRSPPELIGETAAGSVILIFMANMLTPVAFAAFVAHHRPLRSGLPGVGGLQPGLPAAALRASIAAIEKPDR